MLRGNQLDILATVASQNETQIAHRTPKMLFFRTPLEY